MSSVTTDRPSVSVIIPTRDRPHLLQRAVDSVLRQDYQGSVECLVVFDQTRIQHIEWPVRTPNRWVRAVRNTRTPGLAGARNTGYLAASGELLGNCDDDDEWFPHKISAQVRLLTENATASVVSSGVLISYGDRDIPRPAPGAPLDFADFIRHRHPEIHPSTFLTRRTVLEDGIGLVDEEIPASYAEDYEWLLRAARVGPVHAVPAPLVRVHWHAESYFSTKWQKIHDALTWLLDAVPEFDRDPLGKGRIEGQIAFSAAALGKRQDALAWLAKALRHNPGGRQAWASLLLLTGLATPERVLALGHRFGRGI
ncbi:glycosyltransferase family 2 protein [Amycolatopsis sp. GM8]|uniref:glycosyltransferase family 2 protein n=1 Tax=Amycolatopsis sp. GM8 TaxID=2896530 RepID=UPI001F19E111|nr:glycosyltransferase family 2 protein [Amycolatopsis sp. GM8]